MNALSSECSSGCESGWTHYFEHSSSNDDDAIPSGEPKKDRFGKKGFQDEDDQEEEDLSMVSDASSGPPIHCEAVEDEEAPRRSMQTNSKRQRMMIRRGEGQGLDVHSMLDDTASSPAIPNHCVRKSGFGFQEGRRSAFQEQQHYDDGFLHSAITGHHHDNNQLKTRN